MSIKSIDLKFTSANSVPVDRASVAREEWDSVKAVIDSMVKALEPLSRGQTKEDHKASKHVARRVLKQFQEAKQ